MGTLNDLLTNTKAAMKARIGSVLMIREHGQTDATDRIVMVRQGASGGLEVEAAAGATLVDTSTLATQVTAAAILALLQTPTKHTAITPHDDTDLATLANFGIYVGGDGNLAYRTAGTAGTTVTLAVVQGQFVYGAFTRVMAATTATNLVGVAR